MNSRRRVRLAILLATLGAVSALALAACGSSNDSSSGSGSTQGSASKPKQSVLIGASVWAHVPWLDSYGKSLQALGKKNGIDVNVLYSDANASTQTSQIEALLSKKPKAVIFTGIDPSADNAVLAKIKAAGIITVGGIIEPTKAGMDLVDAYRGPNDFTHGKLGAQAMAKALEGKCCEVAIVRGDPGGTDNINRAKAFKAELKALRPDLKIVADQDSSFGDEKKPYDVTAAILASHPKVIGVFTEADTIANAAAKAVADAKLTGKVAIVGVGGSCEGFAAVKKGTVYSTTLQDPPAGAQQVLDVTLKLIKGEKVPKIAYMDLPVITKANVDKYTCHW